MSEACIPGPSGHCSVCGDEGRIGVVEALLRDGAAARVRMEDTGALEEVALDLVDPVRPRERLVVHMGFALATVRGGDT